MSNFKHHKPLNSSHRSLVNTGYLTRAKMKLTTTCFRRLILLCSMLVVSVHAQTIRSSNEIFEDKPVMPFAPAKAITAQPSDLPFGSAQVMASTFQLEKGKKVDVQLSAFGQRTGWTLVWQAPDYILDQPMVLPGEFESAVINFLSGANEAGFRLRAIFYRGNKTVRITEN